MSVQKHWVITPDLFLPGIINPDVILCAICGEIMTQPAILIRRSVDYTLNTSCNHIFCRTCIPGVENSSCPICRAPYQYYMEIAPLRAIVNNQQMKCVNKECKIIFDIGDMPRHQLQCLYEMESCHDCKKEYLRKEKNKHVIECPYRLTPCQYCKGQIKFCEMQQHFDTCTDYPTKCIRAGCKLVTKRYKLGIHYKYCQYMEEKCPLNCPLIILRRDVEKHKKECQNRIVKCGKCKMEHKYCQQREHMYICPAEIISCSCGTTFQRCQMASHVAKCGEIKIPCIYFGICCHEFVVRNKMGEHLSKKYKDHQYNMASRIDLWN